MANIEYFLKKNFKLFVIIIFLIHITYFIVNIYFFRILIRDNILTISTFIKSFTEVFDKKISNKIKLSEQIFKDVLIKFEKNKFRNIFHIKDYIFKKYHLIFDVTIISPEGIILNSTNKNEIGLDLSQYQEAKETLENCKKTGKISIDFPVLDSTHKYFNIYILKYLKSKGFFFQLSYKIDIINKLIENLKVLNGIRDFKYLINLIYVYKEEKYKFFTGLISTKQFNFNLNIVRKLLEEQNSSSYLQLNISGADFYKLAKYDFKGSKPRYNLLYIISFKSLLSKEIIFLFIFSNVFLLFMYWFVYKHFYRKVKINIVNPLKYFTICIKNSKPLLSGEFNNKMKEFEELKNAYILHLENIKLRDFLKNIINAQEQERNRIAKEIHDSIIQDLSYILLKLKQLKQNELSDILAKKIKILRTLVDDYDISMLKFYGLNIYLTHLIEKFINRYSKIIFQYEITKDIDKITDINKAINIVRIIEEIINNSAKHSECTKIYLKFEVKNNTLYITVNDNGKGFNVEESIFQKNHFGLINIKERVYILNGKLDIKSDKNGTEYNIEIPIL